MCSRGLLDRFGRARVFNTPLAEQASELPAGCREAAGVYPASCLHCLRVLFGRIQLANAPFPLLSSPV